MHAQAVDRTLPRGALVAAAMLVIGTLVLVVFARLTGYTPAKPPPSRAVQSYLLRFEDGANGSVLVLRADDGRVVDTIAPGTEAFVRSVLRGMARERRVDHVGAQPPFRLTRWADGRLSLDDPTTGRHIDLEVFGPTNAGAFADILRASAAH